MDKFQLLFIGLGLGLVIGLGAGFDASFSLSLLLCVRFDTIILSFNGYRGRQEGRILQVPPYVAPKKKDGLDQRQPIKEQQEQEQLAQTPSVNVVWAHSTHHSLYFFVLYILVSLNTHTTARIHQICKDPFGLFARVARAFCSCLTIIYYGKQTTTDYYYYYQNNLS